LINQLGYAVPAMCLIYLPVFISKAKQSRW